MLIKRLRNFILAYVPWLLPPLRKLYYLPSDVFRSRSDSLIPTPPKGKIFVGDGDFDAIGEEFLQIFIEHGGLQASDQVLDVGSGIGRMAKPLAGFLSESGSYEGFDIVSDGVEWCRKNISSVRSDFRFTHLNVYNKNYNHRGTLSSETLSFPYEDNRFDFVLLTSVFTHMTRSSVENYLREITRVLKPRGRCLITFFLLNEESEALMAAGKNSKTFDYEYDGCKVENQLNPEAAIAFQEAEVRQMYEKFGLAIENPIRYGAWAGRSDYLSMQDIIVATKP